MEIATNPSGRWEAHRRIRCLGGLIRVDQVVFILLQNPSPLVHTSLVLHPTIRVTSKVELHEAKVTPIPPFGHKAGIAGTGVALQSTSASARHISQPYRNTPRAARGLGSPSISSVAVVIHRRVSRGRAASVE
jgi:hypothetical protein